MKESAPEKLVGALVNGLAILRYLQKARGGVGVTQVARDLAINPSTCFNLLRTLVHEGLASFDQTTKTYALSMGVVSLAQGALDRENHIRVLHPELQRLALKFGVAMNLWQVVEEDRVVLVDRAEPTATVQISMRIGQRLPLFSGALGRCFATLSNLPKAKMERQFKKVRLARPLDFDQWYTELQQVREAGFAVDRGNFAIGITTVAIALSDAKGQPFLAVSAIGISEQIDDAKLEALSHNMLGLAKIAEQKG
ncbi:transcriptional regulator, IclR family [Thalassovita litoralis]|jgi:DNA-binding IclR family transcriptional regulator|uniref:Transcriptional regulator, IclR family n=1 Tax=Thalassovita litoralis TaxID=1010611 RepID=A0A521BMQ8_9RHOB|nr:IclR family transcriptional regulator [Thalassovita litoralis]SMO48437.1 transcriptional regulator, IclR family [Thalassovita litoralis]